MAALPTELPELMDWLKTMIEQGQGQPFQIVLNSSGDMVDAMAKITQSRHTNRRGHTMTISTIENVKFRLRKLKRTTFSTE